MLELFFDRDSNLLKLHGIIKVLKYNKYYINFMKLKIVIFLLLLSLLIPVIYIKAATAPNNLKGRILLQVESKGEAWYVNPKDGKRHYMANGDEAFQIMKTLGVGVSNKDMDKIKTDANYRKKFIGKILLQVESHGEAYYISFDGRYNYLKDGASAYQVMRKLGLGISNKDLAKITTENKYVTKIINNKDPLTGEALPDIKIKTTQKIVDSMSENKLSIISMPSIIDFLSENGVSNSDPKMRVIGPFYQVFSEGKSFGGAIDFSFCYFDEDIRGYNENLFYIGKENSGVWENIGGTPKPEENCVSISLESAPDYTIAVYAGIE